MSFRFEIAWERLLTTVLGPVMLAVASVSGISWSGQLTLLISGALLTGVGFIATEILLRQQVVESILDTAVNFIRSVGAPKVRANLMVVKNQKNILPRYCSSNYRDFERRNEWARGDGSCAAAALELMAPAIGGMTGELIPQNDRSDVTVMKMVSIPNETTRTVLSVPVFRKKGRHEVIGILNFVDDLGMNKSKLASPEVIQAVSRLAPIIDLY